MLMCPFCPVLGGICGSCLKENEPYKCQCEDITLVHLEYAHGLKVDDIPGLQPYKCTKCGKNR
jgi:hypothetical protein